MKKKRNTTLSQMFGIAFLRSWFFPFFLMSIGTVAWSQTATITATDATASETATDEGSFTVTLSPAPVGAVTVDYTISGRATNGVDYGTITTSVTIPALGTSATIDIQNIVDDGLVEDTEDVIITLDAGTGYTVGANDSATVNIADNDTAVISLDTASIHFRPTAEEENEVTGQYRLASTEANNTGQDIVVTYTMSGTATQVTDYDLTGGALVTDPNGNIFFGDGDKFRNVNVKPVDDTLVEGDETVIITLTGTNHTSFTIDATNNSATVTIEDNDTRTLSVDSPTAVAEGDTGTASIDFTVSLSQSEPSNAVTVDYAISGGNEDSDTGTLTFPAGTTTLTQTVEVTTDGDTVIEANEAVSVTLSNASANASIGTATGNSSFTDDDAANITIDSPTAVAEGNTGTASIDFTVSISQSDPSNAVTVDYAISGGNEDSDTGTLTFPAG
ncbi:MAG: Calx-beta domain-containing protein, partial [Flavobacteriaceae bacterium]